MKQTRICYLPLQYFIPLLIILGISVRTGYIGNDIISIFAFLYLISGLFFYVGGRLPFVGKYLGGSLLLPLFGGSALVYFNIVPKDLYVQIENFVASGFLSLVLGTVIVGAILTIDRLALIKTSIRLLPSLIGAQFTAILLLGLASRITGRTIIEGIYMTGLPNFCGGSSGGVVALPEMYSQLFGGSIASYAGKFIVLLNIANVICILFATILNRIGKRMPQLTGNGKLLDVDDPKMQSSLEKITIDSRSEVDTGVHISTGLIVSVMVFVLARVVSGFMPFLNYIVWATIIAIFIKIVNLDNEHIRISVKECQDFMIKTFLPMIIMGIGVTQVDLVDTISLFSPINLFVIAMGVLGSIIGSLVLAKVLGLYPIDAMIGIGCNTAALGLSGVITVLSASERMELMPYSLIVNRFGGALMLVIINVSIVFFMA